MGKETGGLCMACCRGCLSLSELTVTIFCRAMYLLTINGVIVKLKVGIYLRYCWLKQNLLPNRVSNFFDAE